MRRSLSSALDANWTIWKAIAVSPSAYHLEMRPSKDVRTGGYAA